jgi:hypothetical protein
MGKDVKSIVLHPTNQHLASEVGDHIQVSYCPGCLSWECWLGISNNFAPPSPAHAGGSILEPSAGVALGEAQSAQKSSTACFSKIINSKHHAPRPRGRPPKFSIMVGDAHPRGRPEKLSSAQVRGMREKGAHPQDIATTLKVSLATVYRQLGKAKNGVKT